MGRKEKMEKKENVKHELDVFYYYNTPNFLQENYKLSNYDTSLSDVYLSYIIYKEFFLFLYIINK